jgi:hypothetical protein
VSAQLADVLARRGRHAEAERRAEESRTIASHDDLDAQARWRSALARVLVSRAERDAGEHLVREALALLEPTDFVVLAAEAHDLLGEVLAGAGRTDEAAVAVERAIALHEQKGNAVSAARSRAALGRLVSPS